MDDWSQGAWWGYCRTCHPDSVSFGQYEWMEGGLCPEGHDDCVPLPRVAYCVECDGVVPLTREGSCTAGHRRALMHHHQPAQTDTWPLPASEYFEDAEPGGPVYSVWHPWTYMYYTTEDVLAGRASTYAYRTRDGHWETASGHWGKTLPHAPSPTDQLPEWMTELLSERPPKRAWFGLGTRHVAGDTQAPPPPPEPMNWTSPAIMAALVVLALWLLSIWTRGGG